MFPWFNPRLSSAEHTSNFIDFQKSQSDRRRELQVVDKTNRYAQIMRRLAKATKEELSAMRKAESVGRRPKALPQDKSTKDYTGPAQFLESCVGGCMRDVTVG